MRSIAAKLTMAFLLVGLLATMGAMMNLFFQIRIAFNQFVQNQYQETVVQNMVDYYQAHGNSWGGISSQLSTMVSLPSIDFAKILGFPSGSIPYTLVGADRTVILSNSGDAVGDQIAFYKLSNAIPIKSNGQTAGWIVLAVFSKPLQASSSEGTFFASINRAFAISVFGSLLLAVILGGVLAFTMTRSLRDLTEATDEIAKGKLGRQVKVRSKDELGRLALSFNKMSREMAQTTTLRRQMTADIAHDLRTPISIISGYAETLSDKTLEGNPEVYEIMYQETRHLSRLVEDLRTLSLADAGELALFREMIPVNDFLERVAARHQVTVQQRGITLKLELEPQVSSISADPERLSQVFDNLINNAFHYTANGGEIVLMAKSGKAEVQFTIRDNGSGISSEDLPFIFNRFYRGDPARPENGESGLGLAIAKSIVEAHGGTISIESTPGEGTTIRFTMPFGQKE